MNRTKSILFGDYAIFVMIARNKTITYVLGSATLAEGENLNQSFIKSAVNVVAGDQIYGNKARYDITDAERQPSTAHQGYINDR